MTTQAMAALCRMDTTTVSDALDKLGIAGQCLGIKPLDPGFRAAGPAFTIRYVPCGTRGGTVGDYIDDLGPGTVVALDNQLVDRGGCINLISPSPSEKYGVGAEVKIPEMNITGFLAEVAAIDPAGITLVPEGSQGSKISA